MKKNIENHIFYHMFCVNECIDIFTNAFDKIKHSGLYSKTKTIHLHVNGSREDISLNILQLPKDPKIQITKHITNTHGEGNTLVALTNFCLNNDCNVLYLHTKGVTRPNNKNTTAWRNYMEFFMIEKFDECICRLPFKHTIGVDYLEFPHKHYSGNFWWSTSEYIKSKYKQCNEVSITNFTDRMECEFWLLKGSNHEIYEAHNSNADLYANEYLRSNYT
tara:strand:+ start:4406 stop:5062 length:657 start_codon:yes stop_codon:yes gene_type:complete